MALLYIVRHGNTFETGEVPRRIGVRSDLPLTVAGREQAQRLGEHFATIPFRLAWAGKLRRTQETADLILAAQAVAPPTEHVQVLDEIDHGLDENQPESAVIRRIGEPAVEAWESALQPPPGWEIGLEWRRDGWRDSVARLTTLPADAPVLAVTSNGAARLALLCLGVGRSPAKTKLRTGSYGVVRLRRDAVDVLEWDVRP